MESSHPRTEKKPKPVESLRAGTTREHRKTVLVGVFQLLLPVGIVGGNVGQKFRAGGEL